MILTWRGWHDKCFGAAGRAKTGFFPGKKYAGICNKGVEFKFSTVQCKSMVGTARIGYWLPAS